MVKAVDQLDLQAMHRVRERLVSQRTGIINQIRASLLERNGRRGATLLTRLAYSSIRPSASATVLPG
jgi:transposase